MNQFDLKQIQEELGSIHEQKKTIVEVSERSAGILSKEQIAQWDNLDAIEMDLKEKAESAKRIASFKNNHEEVKEVLQRSVRTETGASYYDVNQVVRGHLLARIGDEVPEECKRSAQKLNFNLNTGTVVCQRDQTIGSAGTGGNLVPVAPFGGLYEKMKAFGGLETICDVIHTATGNTIPWAVEDDTTNLGAIRAELATTANTAMAWTKTTLGAYRISSGCYKISKELVTDSQFDVQARVSYNLAKRLHRKAAALYVSGAGSTEPTGLLSQAGNSSVQLASDTTISFSELCDIVGSIDPAYYGQLRWVFNHTTRKILSKLVDDNNRPMYLESMRDGMPPTLLGYPVTIVQEMPNISGDEVKPILFGDFSQATIRMAGPVETQVINELYVLEYAIGMVSSMRTDIILPDSNAVKYVTSKNAA